MKNLNLPKIFNPKLSAREWQLDTDRLDVELVAAKFNNELIYCVNEKGYNKLSTHLHMLKLIQLHEHLGLKGTKDGQMKVLDLILDAIYG